MVLDAMPCLCLNLFEKRVIFVLYVKRKFFVVRMSVSIMYLGYYMFTAPEGSLRVVIYFLIIVMVRRIRINIVVLVIIFGVVWHWVPITMVHHIFRLG